MSKSRKVQRAGAGRPGPGAGRREDGKLPPIGGTREEIQATLVRTMHGILDGRIEPKEAYAIGRLCKLQLKLLGFMEQLEREMERKRKESKSKKGKQVWLN